MVSSIAYRKYGQQHGTAFFVSEESASEYLDYMEKRLASNFAEYLEGFCEGITGSLIRVNRQMIAAGDEFKTWMEERGKQ